jgi:hypothetical protein
MLAWTSELRVNALNRVALAAVSGAWIDVSSAPREEHHDEDCEGGADHRADCGVSTFPSNHVFTNSALRASFVSRAVLERDHAPHLRQWNLWYVPCWSTRVPAFWTSFEPQFGH